MNAEYRRTLTKLLAKYDQFYADGDRLLAEPVITPEDQAKAKKVIARLKQMRAAVETKPKRVRET